MLATTEPFTVRHDGHLRQLFKLTDIPWSDDQATNAKAAAQRWLGGEHGKTVVKYPSPILTAVLPLGEAMGMRDATSPPPGTVLDGTNNLGGTITAAIKRYELNKKLKAEGYRLGPITGWYGQRLRQVEREGAVNDIVARLEAQNLLNHPWVKHQLTLGGSPNPWRQPFATEYEIGIVAAILVFGINVSIAHTEEIEEASRLPGVPGRAILWQRLTLPDDSSLYVLNCAAQERILDGRPSDPRPTTESSAQEWLTVFHPKFGSSIGLVSGNPHTERTIGDVDRIFARSGRSDLKITVIGTAATAATEAAELQLARAMLGEIARLLNNEQRDN